MHRGWCPQARILQHGENRDHQRLCDHEGVAGRAVVLASHAERGEVWDKAAQYFVEALAQAVEAFAYHEAIALYDRVLHALQPLPASTSAPLSVRAGLLVFDPLISLSQVDRALDVTREAETLARELGDSRQVSRAKIHLAYALWGAGRLEAGLQSADEAFQLANELDDVHHAIDDAIHRADGWSVTASDRREPRGDEIDLGNRLASGD